MKEIVWRSHMGSMLSNILPNILYVPAVHPAKSYAVWSMTVW